jgi:2',3'-cyclic-nucleotide 2'-phosphodiesterase/3'-nucleotidase
VSIRDVAGLYPVDNHLVGVQLTGAQLTDVLERSATYFRQVDRPSPHTLDEVVNGIPDYNYDVAAGLDKPLTYDIDIAQPEGQRIVNLAYGGVPVRPDQRFAVAVNNYRQSGGGDFPHIPHAPVLHHIRKEIRLLLIDWVKQKGEINPAAFLSWNWKLTANGLPVQIPTMGTHSYHD